ncbi:hypothetical protein KO481_35760 [Nocardia sp. NEAU-G5]|uniref:Uncharacterized protein n=1 Tax=Nocardia albiluteola TaxID=2842303 RepID=A0ABS6B9B4_9NOCA|nr:hypothetical protein [Nocardia albiluteola]MBU3066864.1 hypothetical protein [Nocardia albiluteola]
MAESVPGTDLDLERKIGSALRWSLVVAAGFVAFAWITTQVKTVRAASPWQNDPYDVVVSFTEFLVPALACLVVARMVLRRSGEPQPRYRTVQLLRAAAASTLLVTATMIADWIAVVVRAGLRTWSAPTTPLLVGALALLTAGAVTNAAVQRNALGRLPSAHIRRGDWLDDLVPLVTLVTGRDPENWAHRCAPMIAFVRRHFIAVTALAAVTSALALALTQAVGEGWTDPLLFVFAVVVAAGGFFAAAVMCNGYLVVVARPRATGRVRRALRAAGACGALGLPATVAVRAGILHVIGHDHDVSVAHLLVLILAGAALAAAVAFAAALVRRRPPAPER